MVVEDGEEAEEVAAGAGEAAGEVAEAAPDALEEVGVRVGVGGEVGDGGFVELGAVNEGAEVGAVGGFVGDEVEEDGALADLDGAGAGPAAREGEAGEG